MDTGFLPSDKHFKASHRREQHKKRHDSNSKRFRQDVTPSLASVVQYHTSPQRGNKQRNIGPILWSTVHRDRESPRRKLFRSRSRERKDAKYNDKQMAMCHKNKAKKKVHSRKTYTDLMVTALRACHDAITNKTKTAKTANKNKKDEEKKRKPAQNESISQNSEGKRLNKRRRGRSSLNVLSARELPAVVSLEEKENHKMSVNDADVESSCLGKETVTSLAIPYPSLLDYLPNFLSSKGASLNVHVPPPTTELSMVVSHCPSGSNGFGEKEMVTKETAEPPQGTLEEETKKKVWCKSEYIKSMNQVLEQLRDEASKHNNNDDHVGSKTPTPTSKTKNACKRGENFVQEDEMIKVCKKKKEGKKVSKKEHHSVLEKTPPVPCKKEHSVRQAKEVVEEPVSPAEEVMFNDILAHSSSSGSSKLTRECKKKKSSSKSRTNNGQKKNTEVNEKNGKIVKSTKQVGKPRAHQKGKNKKNARARARGGHGLFYDEKDGFFDEKGFSVEMDDFFIHHHPLLQVEHKRSRRMRKRELLEAATRRGVERGNNAEENGIQEKRKALLPVERRVERGNNAEKQKEKQKKDMGQNPSSASPTHVSSCAATVQNTIEEKELKQKKQGRKIKKQNTGGMEKKEKEARKIRVAGKCSEEKQKKKEKKEKKKEEEREERKTKKKKELIVQKKEEENAVDRNDDDNAHGWTVVGDKKKKKKNPTGAATSILPTSTTISTAAISGAKTSDVFPKEGIKNPKGEETIKTALKTLVRKKKKGEEERDGKLKEEKAKKVEREGSGSNSKKKLKGSSKGTRKNKTKQQRNAAFVAAQCREEKGEQYVSGKFDDHHHLERELDKLRVPYATLLLMFNELLPNAEPPVKRDEKIQDIAQELGFIDLSYRSSTEWHLLSSDTTINSCTEVSIITTMTKTTSEDKHESKNERKHVSNNTCDAAAFCDEWLLVDDMDEDSDLLASPLMQGEVPNSSDAQASGGAAKKGWDFAEIEESRKRHQQEFEEWTCID